MEECAHAEHGSTTHTSMHGSEDVPATSVDVWTVMTWAVALTASRKTVEKVLNCMMADWC